MFGQHDDLAALLLVRGEGSRDVRGLEVTEGEHS
jgi:hypothetical protein